jgi:small nuclear ribonucleoprotein (snRNP)-like protein
MIKNDVELEGTLERIKHFTNLVLNMRKVEKNPSTYEASAGGFLAEIAKMNLEVNEYLSIHPSRFEGEREKIAA